jgi:hypothetical protein
LLGDHAGRVFIEPLSQFFDMSGGNLKTGCLCVSPESVEQIGARVEA